LDSARLLRDFRKARPMRDGLRCVRRRAVQLEIHLFKVRHSVGPCELPNSSSTSEAPD
jgi:hypothetical protein